MKHHQQILIVLSAILVLCSCQLTRNIYVDQKHRRLPSDCGRSDSKFPVDTDSKIINGRNATLGAFPWMAALVYQRPNSSEMSWGCAGSLITDQYVITAAHCAIPSFTSGLVLHSVRLGDLDLDDSVDDGASPIDVMIEEVIPHEKYDNIRKVNDIALIKLKTKVQFTDLIKPICLPPREFSTNMFVGYSPTIAGWGKSNKSSNARPETILKEADVTIQDTESCKRNVTAKLKEVTVDQTMICAGSDRQGKRPLYDSCKGDSGGPLMFSYKKKSDPLMTKGKMHLMGIVSYGYNCAEEGYPGVYTRVSEHMLWIIHNLDI